MFSDAFFIPAGLFAQPHSHIADSHLHVASGELRLAYGREFVLRVATAYPAGMLLFVPRGAPASSSYASAGAWASSGPPHWATSSCSRAAPTV